ncbi:hypothetical protein ACJMK2_037988 [Sinanodonta woodiana]|uniref:Urea active transporter 1 n=1 Tax=Sinanodonta woodiana TaxID=1069815 RepID=A0ABD3WM51_SINWO
MGYIRNRSDCQFLVDLVNATKAVQGITPSVELHEVLLIVIGFGVFTSLVTILFQSIRKHVYSDKNLLDTAFDAGGKVSFGLTATTIVSQWTWAATLLYSCTVASKYGISGPFWYAAGATIQILLFAMLSVQLKIRAPGAKTFLQVIRARFGSTTHKIFCFYALLTNIIVTANLMLGGATVLSSLSKGVGVEYATILMTALIGTYTFTGGLGATFYVSYFNTAVIFICMLISIIKVFNDPDDSGNPLGNIENVYKYLSCSEGPEGNKDHSYLTILSQSGLMFGLITMTSAFGTSNVDQSYWQSSVAAKPRQGVLGFLSGGLAWFAVPFALATSMGLAYIALSARQNSPLISEEDPFRLVLDSNSCILCGKGRGRKANVRDKCICQSMTVCRDCASDDRQREIQAGRPVQVRYKCLIHGPFREYTDYLARLKSWCLLWTTLAIIPLSILFFVLQLNLSFIQLFMGVAINSAVLPITLCMFWETLTGVGMMAGSVCGTLIAIASWLSASSTYPGGLSNFLINTTREVPSLVGNIVSLFSGGLIAVVVSLLTSPKLTQETRTEIWESTRDIDNPLSPWTELYAKDLNLSGAHRLDNRPTLMDVQRAFRGAKYLASIGSISVSIILVIVWPSFMVLGDVMSFHAFTIFIIVTPLVNEVYDIYQTTVTRRRVRNVSIEVDIQDNSSSSKSPYHRNNPEELSSHAKKLDSPIGHEMDRPHGYQENMLYINEMRSPRTDVKMKNTSTELDNFSTVNESVQIQSPKSCASSSFESQSVFP